MKVLGYGYEFNTNMKNKEEMIPIYLRRCFDGWGQIKDKFVYPSMDGDIILWIEKDAFIDAKDAQTIIDYLQRVIEEKQLKDS